VSRFDLPALLHELTLEEKATLVSGSGFWHTRAIGRVDLPSIMVSDGPHGLRKQPGPGDHVGAGRSVPATCFPTAGALGSSWDVDLVQEVGAAIATEARAQGVSVVLGPGINIKRSPLCGRNFEYLSEDPVISGVLGAALVHGIQSQGVGTSLKHFAVNNQETDRLRVSAVVDERTLREIYLAGFERVVRDGSPWTVMCSYNRINGVYASQDRWLLTDLLRDEWGFDGLVMSDWGAVDDPVAAVAAGLDLEMPSSKGVSARRIVDAVRAGDLDEVVLDTAIGRLVGLLERALPEAVTSGSAAADGSPAPVEFDAHAHHALARRAAAEGVVLLKNDGDLLPLDPDAVRLAVIGEFARTPRFQGAGSSKVNPTRVDDALTELRTAVGDGASVTFAPGFGVDDPDAEPDLDDAALLADAVEVARAAETVVVFLGLPASEESEGFDRTHIDLPASQLAVLDAVAAVNPRVVVVLANGGVVAVHGWEHRAPAILEAWLGGQAGGGGVVDVLLGTVNPAGRLTETIPRRLADTPAHLYFPGEERQVHYGEGVFVGYRHHDAVGGDVSYPFGHGLSYTTFAHTDLEVAVVHPDGDGDGDGDPGWRGADRVTVSLTVTNTGPRAGREVVQLYVGRTDGAGARPVRELKAFTKVALEPAASTRVSFTLTERDLSRWSVRAGGWVPEPGRYRVDVGASSRDLRLGAEVVLGGEPPALPLDRHSSIGEWLEHPVGRDVLLEAMRAAPGGDLTPLFANPEQLRTIASFPLPRLMTMMGGNLGDGGIDALLDALLDAVDARS
jgi:beta-glucosidase